MAKKGKANNKPKNNKKGKAQEAPENQTPQTPQTETPPEQQPEPEPEPQPEQEVQQPQEPSQESQESQPETPQPLPEPEAALEQPQEPSQESQESQPETPQSLPEPEATLEQPQPAEEHPPTAPETVEQPSSTNVDEGASAEPVSIPDPFSNEQPAVDVAQEYSEQPKPSSWEELETSMPHAEGGEVSSENDNIVVNDTNGFTNGVTDDTDGVPEDTQNDEFKDTFDSTVDVQDNTLNGTSSDAANDTVPVDTENLVNDGHDEILNNDNIGETQNGGENDTATDKPINALDDALNTIRETINDTLNNAPETPVDQQHHDTAESTEPTVPPVPTEQTEPQSTEFAEPVEPTVSTEPIETVEPAQTTEFAEPIEPTVSTKPVEPIEPVEPVEPVESAQSTEPIEPVEPTQSTELAEPVEPTVSTQLVEHIEPIEPAQSTEFAEPVEPIEPVQSTEPVEPVEPAESAEKVLAEPEHTEIVEPVEPVPTKVAESVAPAEPTILAEPVKPTELAEHSEPTALAEPEAPAAPTEPAEPVEQVPDIAARHNSFSQAPDSTPFQSPFVAEPQTTPGHPQSSVGSPTFESFSSPMSHVFPETETTGFAPQPASSEPKLDTPRATSPILQADTFVPQPQTNPFAAHTSPVQQPASHIPQPTEPVPNVFSFMQPSTPVPQVDSAFSVQQGASPASPLSKAATPRAPDSPAQKAASPIAQTALFAQHSSPTQQPESPLKPVQPPSPVPQSRSPAQKATYPIPQSASPVSKAAALAQQKAAPPVQKNGTSVQKNGSSSKSISPIQKLASPVQKAAYPTYKAPSPVPKPASPVPRVHSPTPRVSSPLARPTYFSPMMSPHTHTAMPPQAAQPAPTMVPGPYPFQAPGFATAVQSPILSAGFLPPYTHSPYHAHPPPFPQQHPTHSQASHQTQGSGYIDPAYMSSFQTLRELSMANGQGYDGKGMDAKGHIPAPDTDGEHIQLLQRIQDAIPDLSRLLHGYKSTQSKLLARESEIKQIQAQNEQSLMHKDFYIEALQNQMRKAAAENAEETNKLKNIVNELRMELGNLEEKHKDMEESLIDAQKSNQQLSQWKIELECQVTKLNTDIQEEREAHEKEIEKQKDEHADALATQKREMTETFEEIKAEDERAHKEAMESRENQLLDQQESMKNDYENQKQQMHDAHNALQADFDTKVTELESTQTDLSNTKDDLDAKHKELEDTREAHANEIENMNAEFDDKQRQWEEHRTDLETQISQKTEELNNTEQERERLEGECIHKEKQLQHAVEEMRTTMGNMDKDHDRLKKTLQSLGEATDLKSSKGDSFFLDCFGQLSRLIVALSKEHFAYLPIDPPKDILSKIPPELPSFLDNTPASRELRSAYVQHVISKTLNYRIFQPFLFTLGRRYDKADTFFQMLSMDIRRKSVRREAFWRQQTLKAAYTASDAKQSINVVAAVIVDEIIDHIKHLADPKQLDNLLASVRKIVKLAAETWRHARVERELVLATLPAPDAEGVSNKDWEEYGTPKEGSLSSKEDPTRHVLLRIFPQITREAAHEDFTEDQEKEAPCMYSLGSVLYSDSPVVMDRRQELAKKSAEENGADRRGSRGSLRSPSSPKLGKKISFDSP